MTTLLISSSLDIAAQAHLLYVKVGGNGCVGNGRFYQFESIISL